MNEDDEQRRKTTDALVKVLGLAIVLGLLVSLGAYALITSVGLGNGTVPAADSTGKPSQLPTRAIDESGAPEEEESPSANSSAAANKRDIALAATPVLVRPNERINLTGSYPGRDGIRLQVQRLENGQWASFSGVTAAVTVGKFSTWVKTGRVGDQRFRMFDPQTGKASNVVRVTVQ